MAEDFEDEHAQRLGDSMATQIALSEGSKEAREYLRKHSRLLDLEIENLQKQDEYETSHLRWRRFNDQMRGAMQIMLVAVGALVVAGIGAAVWNASQANGLVVDAFTAPPDFESRGMGGDVIAGDLTDRLAAIRAIAVANSYSSSNDVKQNRANEIKVEIPETGVSISEAWRYLRSWLGHERHLTGSLRETGGGKITLVASLDGAGASTQIGAPADLPKMEQKAAEEIFGEFDPVGHVNYLSVIGRFNEAYEAAARYTAVAQGVLARSDSYALWSYTTADATGDFALAIARTRVGLSIDPALAVLRVQAMSFYRDIGDDERELYEARAILPLRNEEQMPAHQGGGFASMQAQARGVIAFLLGDFADANGWNCGNHCTAGRQIEGSAILEARAHGISQSRALLVHALAVGQTSAVEVAEAHYYEDAAAKDWAAATADASAARAAWSAQDDNRSERYVETASAVIFSPLVALAEAHAGQFSAAHREIDKTPAGCVSCETARGDIDVLKKSFGGAEYWFARAIHDGPSIPFADTDWGAMLLANGDLAGAIAKFESANKKGPHFADPLEMWGEVLTMKNRSDLALAKFEEANRYAPNWGRLHLKWGEALIYAGKPDEAKAQFAAASRFDLSRSDAVVLAREWHP